MPKVGEINYLNLLGPAGIEHAFNKPFSDQECSRYLMDLGAIIGLLPPPPARILDCGVGTGWTSVFLAKRGYEVVGQDIAQDMIDLAMKNKERYQVSNLSFVVSDYENLNFQSEFDGAVFYDSLHHAEDERTAIKSICRALKPNGVCVTMEPGETHSQQPNSIEAMRLFGVTEKDMPPHLIIDAGKAAGFNEFEVFKRPTILEPVEPVQPLPPAPGRLRRIYRAIFHKPPIQPAPIDYYRISSLVRMRKK